jgi:hypothetical protein
MKHVAEFPKAILTSWLLVMWSYLVPVPAHAGHAGVSVLHTYAHSLGHEIDNAIAVDAATLAPLLPAGYVALPASALGVGGPDEGIVAIVNFEGLDPVTDNRPPGKENRVAIDVGILVSEPAQAAAAGLSFASAFHFYTLAMYSNDAPYFASLRSADMPIEFVPKLAYVWQVDNAGSGQLAVDVPARRSPFTTFNAALGYMATGSLHAIFWHNGGHGTTALHFDIPVFRQANAFGRVYTEPGNVLATLITGGGLGPCTPDPVTGFSCVATPSLGFSFDNGNTGQLLSIR